MPTVVLSLCLKPLSIASLNLCCVTHESMEGNITLGPSYLTNGDADDFHVLCSLSGNQKSLPQTPLTRRAELARIWVLA